MLKTLKKKKKLILSNNHEVIKCDHCTCLHSDPYLPSAFPLQTKNFWTQSGPRFFEWEQNQDGSINCDGLYEEMNYFGSILTYLHLLKHGDFLNGYLISTLFGVDSNWGINKNLDNSIIYTGKIYFNYHYKNHRSVIGLGQNGTTINRFYEKYNINGEIKITNNNFEFDKNSINYDFKADLETLDCFPEPDTDPQNYIHEGGLRDWHDSCKCKGEGDIDFKYDLEGKYIETYHIADTLKNNLNGIYGSEKAVDQFLRLDSDFKLIVSNDGLNLNVTFMGITEQVPLTVKEDIAKGSITINYLHTVLQQTYLHDAEDKILYSITFNGNFELKRDYATKVLQTITIPYGGGMSYLFTPFPFISGNIGEKQSSLELNIFNKNLEALYLMDTGVYYGDLANIALIHMSSNDNYDDNLFTYFAYFNLDIIPPGRYWQLSASFAANITDYLLDVLRYSPDYIKTPVTQSTPYLEIALRPLPAKFTISYAFRVAHLNAHKKQGYIYRNNNGDIDDGLLIISSTNCNGYINRFDNILNNSEKDILYFSKIELNFQFYTILQLKDLYLDEYGFDVSVPIFDEKNLSNYIYYLNHPYTNNFNKKYLNYTYSDDVSIDKLICEIPASTAVDIYVTDQSGAGGTDHLIRIQNIQFYFSEDPNLTAEDIQNIQNIEVINNLFE